MKAIHTDSGEIQTLNVMNGDTLDFLPVDASIEVVRRDEERCVSGAGRASTGAAVGLIQAVKTYESLAIEAAVTGSREKAALA